MTTRPDDGFDLAEFIDEVTARGTPDDLQRIGRLVRCLDTEADRAHLRLLIVRTLDQVAPDSPDELERIGRLTVASMRGSALARRH